MADRFDVTRSERLRIMHVLACLGNGGTEFGILKLIEGLDPDRFEHRICVTRQYDNEFVKAHRLGEVLFSASGTRRGLQFPMFRLRKLFSQYRPHVVHTRNWGGLEAVLAARCTSVPAVVHSEHGYETMNMAGAPLRQRAFRRVAYSMANQVFTVTAELRDHHARQSWINPDSISVIHNGVDTVRYAPSEDSRELARVDFGIPRHRLVLGSVGRLVAIKDYGTLLRAAELLVTRGVDLHVLLVGLGPESERLKQQASNSQALRDRTTFAGTPERVPQLLNAMDVFILPSLKEGMSNTLLEAMATGLPLIATRVGGNPEVIGEESSEWLFAPGDCQGLAERVWRFAKNPEARVRISAANRERAVTRFSLGRMIEAYTDLYVRVATESGAVSSRLSQRLGLAEKRTA